jgi:hypothetical protein
MIRPADRFLLSLALGCLGFIACFVDATRLCAQAEPELALRIAMVEKLRLTDLALFTEARYTRHPSQADLHSAFQDHPLAFEHFPTGSLMGPPPGLRYEVVTRVGAGDGAAPDQTAPVVLEKTQ